MISSERTVFISYRRDDISWALAVYQNLTAHVYDVFFDYKNIHSGDFDQIIIGNIKARAHFLVILTPTALDRCDEPGDWMRREIETAINERRNIIPLFFENFSFRTPSVSEKLIGKFGAIKKYNGLNVPPGYFEEAMERLRSRYLDITLDAVLHPVSNKVQKVVKEQQVAADEAIFHHKKLKDLERREAVEKLKREQQVLKQDVEKHKFNAISPPKVSSRIEQDVQPPEKKRNFLSCCIGWVAIMLLSCILFSGIFLFQNAVAP